MNKINLIRIIISIVIGTILISIFVINLKNKMSEEYNISNENQTTNQIAIKKSNGVFEIYNTDIKTNDRTTKLTATVKNITANKTEKQIVQIILIDIEQNEIGRMLVTVPSLESNQATEISSEDLRVYDNIYNFKIN